MAKLSHRARIMPASPIRRLVPYADRARARGVHVHHLNIGQPDIETPEGMMKAYHGFAEKVLAYGPSQGLPPLRSAVADHYTKLGHHVAPEHVSVTVGGSEALQFAFSAIADPGDEIVVQEPFYANYAAFAIAADVELRAVTGQSANGFHLAKREAYEKVIGPKTRGIVFTSPGNPTGTVYSAEEVAELGRIAEAHNLFLISDEVYREFAYGGVKVTSALSLPNAAERVIVIDSVSKRFSACGARVGFLISKNPALNDAFMRMCYARLCPATIDQAAAIAAYDTPKSYFDAVVVEYETRRNVLVRGLNQIEGVSTYRPEGAFYTIVTLPVEDAEDFATWLLTDFTYENETVMLAPANGFYATPGLGKKEARIAYVLKVEQLERSLEILRRALREYPR